MLADPGFRQSIAVTVDGKAVKSNRIGRATYSLGTGPYFTLTLAERNILNQPAGEYEATADGLWVTLPPLSRGNTPSTSGLALRP